jgi:uncharacterized protein (TIGR02270 family)
VIDQHADELADLWNIRRYVAKIGHVTLRQLTRFDERIAAHADGCVIAGVAGLETLKQRLVEANAPQLFALSVVALDIQDRATFEHCAMTAEALPESIPGLSSSLGWVSATRLTGVVKEMLTHSSPIRRRAGLSACRMHGIDPGPTLTAAFEDPDAGVRGEACRTAATLGRRDLLGPIRAATVREELISAGTAAEAAVLLGDRGELLDGLRQLALASHPRRAEALELVVRAMDVASAHALLRDVARHSTDTRALVWGAGLAGDPQYVPWLIEHMKSAELARLAGESFCMLTGLEIEASELRKVPSDDFESEPDDTLDDPNGQTDLDEGLPWPDPSKVAAWWTANAQRFQTGVRYFVGAPPTRRHCLEVLKVGSQRQRIAAAQYLCLLDPGTPLFDTSAPAWRQQRYLSEMACPS